MPVSFSLPQCSCYCKAPLMLPPPPLMYAPACLHRNFAPQPAWRPFSQTGMVSASAKPKKIIRIKDPETGHDVTEEILSSASVGQVRSEMPMELPRRPLPPMPKRIPMVVQCPPKCSYVCRPVMPQIPPLIYNCMKCRDDLEMEIWKKGQMEHDPRDADDSKTQCSYATCVPYTNGIIAENGEPRKQYCYTRKFLLKLRAHPFAKTKPQGLPDFIGPDYFNDPDSDKDDVFGRGDYKW